MRKMVLVMLAMCVLSSALTAEAISGLKSRSAGGGSEYNTLVYLYRIEDFGTGPATIGIVRDSNQTQMRVDGLAFSNRLGLWCFDVSSSSQSVLHQLDPAYVGQNSGNGTAFPQRQFFGAAFDRLDRLWALDPVRGELAVIDMTTKTEIATIPLYLSGQRYTYTHAGGDIAFHPQKGLFLINSN